MIFCDSKAGSCYSVTLKQPGQIREITKRIHAAFMAADGGHNGIDVKCGAVEMYVDPDWIEGEQEDGDS